jgi:hypothetical protein
MARLAFSHTVIAASPLNCAQSFLSPATAAAAPITKKVAAIEPFNTSAPSLAFRPAALERALFSVGGKLGEHFGFG